MSTALCNHPSSVGERKTEEKSEVETVQNKLYKNSPQIHSLIKEGQ